MQVDNLKLQINVDFVRDEQNIGEMKGVIFLR